MWRKRRRSAQGVAQVIDIIASTLPYEGIKGTPAPFSHEAEGTPAPKNRALRSCSQASPRIRMDWTFENV